MSTNLKNVLDLIASTVLGSQEITDFCALNFNKKPSLIVGIDPLQPPEFEENSPMILVGTKGRSREETQSHRRHVVMVGCAVKSETQLREGNYVRFSGIELLDDFANLVESKITKAFNQNGYAATQESVFEDETAFPYFSTVWAYHVRCPSRL